MPPSLLLLLGSLAAAPRGPVEALVVPGCPSSASGTISACLALRIAWAAELWDEGVAARIITAGGAAYTPWVEAELMAAGLEALGVPAERIHLDPHSLHTDENMWNALQLAKGRGWETLGVASHGGHTRGSCAYLRSWGASCAAFPMDHGRAEARAARDAALLATVRVPAVPDWRALEPRERARAEALGKAPRRSSLRIYTRDSIRDLLGLEPILPYQHPQAGRGGCWADHPARMPADASSEPVP
jgi:hypothetical protein